MGAGLPVIATPVGGIPDIVKHDVNGVLVSPESPEALKEVLLELSDTPEHVRALREGALAWSADYHWATIAKRIEVLLSDTAWHREGRYSIAVATGIFPPESGGPATYTKLLLEELPWRGISVRFFTRARFALCTERSDSYRAEWI